MAEAGKSLNRLEMQRLTEGLLTKADKIRLLAREGYARQQIADFLGIRYQHVRNVLVDEERKARAALGPPPADWPADLEYKSAVPPDRTGMEEGAGRPPKPVDRARRVDIGPNGELVLPTEIMEAAGTGPGQRLLMRFEDDEIRLMTPAATTRKIQARVRSYIPENVSLVDELREERRLQLEREKRLCGE